MPKTEDEEKEVKTDRVSKPILEPAKLNKPDPIQALVKKQQVFQENVQRNIEALQQQQKAQFAMMQKTMEQFMTSNITKKLTLKNIQLVQNQKHQRQTDQQEMVRQR